VKQSYDVIVIGGGAAGSAAAGYLGSKKWTTLLVDKQIEDGFLGGLKVVNSFPGIKESVSGAEVITRMRNQAEASGVFIKKLEITGVDFASNQKKITGGDQEFEVKAVVLATGAAKRTGYSNGERELLGRGVSRNAEADLSLSIGNEVAVIGKTKRAVNDVMELSKYAKKIYFVIPSNKLDIDNRQLSNLEENSKIELLFSTSLKTINGSDKVESITIFAVGAEKNVLVGAVYDYTHQYEPVNKFLKDALKVEDTKGIPVDDKFKTTVEGIFACGDILCAEPQNPIVSIAQGLLAAAEVDRYLINRK